MECLPLVEDLKWNALLLMEQVKWNALPMLNVG